MKPPKIRDYPASFKIGDEVYTIRFVRKFADPTTVGECDPSEKEIRLKLGQGREETLKTLIHETCHALLEFEGELEIRHQLIYKMENLIYQFLMENF